MNIVLRTDLPRFTDEEVGFWYREGISIFELIAIAVESYRQPRPHDFFMETMHVISMAEDPRVTIDISQRAWDTIYPWLVSLYWKFPAMYHGTVNTVRMDEDDQSLNIQVYMDYP